MVGTLSVVVFSTSLSAQAPASTAARGQQPATRPAAAQRPSVPPPVLPEGVPAPPGYLIGPDDVLSIVYWRDKDMSNEVVVRPDGKISLPLLNDVQAAGLTPEQLGEQLTAESKEYIEDPTVTVVVKEIKSRKVYITGSVGKIGSYELSGPTTVLQLIAMAGGLGEYADTKNIVILRNENGKQVTYRFNYKEVASRKKLAQNIELKPGDTVIVP